MNEIFLNAGLKNNISRGELVREIKKAQKLCGADGISTDEFIKRITLLALERYLEDNL